MERIACFEKISFEQFKKDWLNNTPNDGTVWSDEKIREVYDNIKLPARATSGSAGYDFFLPTELLLGRDEHDRTQTIPTGIRARIEDGWVLSIYPRSGLGFKYRLRLNNTVGIIDSDYYFSDNEGHIMIKLSAEGGEVRVEAGKGFAQGIFTQYGITVDDDVTEVRNGGFGSTTK